MSIEACLTHDRERDRRPYLLIPCFAWLAACGSGQLPRPVLTGRVTVRLAHDDEFNDHPPSDPNDSFHLNWFLAPCPVTGEFAPELAQPVIEFARTNLISRPDNFAIDPTAPINQATPNHHTSEATRFPSSHAPASASYWSRTGGAMANTSSITARIL
jgi:hypothetical protein